jgi:hypothetical protein
MALLAVALIAVVAGCGGSTLQSASGVVISIDSTSPAAVQGFVLPTGDGQTIRFSTTSTRFDRTSFPPEHLREHMALAQPVKVTYQVQDGVNQVTKLEDAPSASG